MWHCIPSVIRETRILSGVFSELLPVPNTGQHCTAEGIARVCSSSPSNKAFKSSQRTVAHLTSESAEHVSQLPAILIKVHDMQGDCSLGALRNAMERSCSIPAKKWEGRLQHPVHCFAHKRGEGSCCQYVTLPATFLFHISDKDCIQSSYCISGPFDGNPEPVILYYQQWCSEESLYTTPWS